MSGSSSQSESNEDWLNSICNIETQGEARRPQKPKIQRIPQMLRRNKSNEDCYEPTVVSIGPYHHGKDKLRLMEELKTRSMKEFLGGVQNKPTFDEFKTKFSEARTCYEEGSTVDFSDDDFTKMMLLDGCFILYFIDCVPNYEKTNMSDQHIGYVIGDLFLLENQLPFIVLEELINLKYTAVDERVIKIRRFIRGQFRLFSAPHHQENQTPRPVECTTTVNIGEDASSQQLSTEADKSLHLLDILWIELVGKDQNGNDSATQPQNGNDSATQQPNEDDDYTFRSVEELRMAGIYCKKSKTSSLKDVHFNSYFFGSLSLPPMLVDDFSESMFLNLIAYEACADSYIGYAVTAYVCLMDSLIDRKEDVEGLRSKGILLNLLGSDKEVAELFNRLAKDLPDVQVYAETTSQIQKHCNNKWKTSWAEAYHTSFGSLWKTAAFIAAFVVIGLTATQTYFTVYPRK